MTIRDTNAGTADGHSDRSEQGSFRGESVIFIISQHRSGSTLLQRILGGHSQVRTGAETFLMLHPLYALKTTGFRAEYREWEARVAVSDYLEHFAGGEETYIDALRAMAAVLYGRGLAGTGKRFFLDKTPRYTNIIPELHRVLPAAKFIFLLRNPLAILRSQLERFETPASFHHLALLRNETILAPPRILAGIDRLGPEAIVVRYEELVTEPERVVAGLCRRLGLAFEPEMIEYGNRPDPPGRGRFYDRRGIQRHRRPTTASLERWRTLADDPQRRHIARAYLFELGPSVVERLGYSFAELREALRGDDDGVVCGWQSLMAPAAHVDAYLDALPGVADFPPSPPLRRVMPETPRRVSVVIPTHASPALFERALRSVLLQQRPNVEVIVVPDASQPGSEAVAAHYAPWVDAVLDPAPGGFFDALQRGFARASGEVLTWLRPGEEHLPWTLATVGEVFAQCVDIGWLCGAQQLLLAPSGRPAGSEDAPPSLATWLGRAPEGDGRRIAPLRFAFVRRTLWDRAGARFDHTLLSASDCELMLRLAALCAPTLAPVALGGVHALPWWQATRYADEAEALVATREPDTISPVPFPRLRRDTAADAWLVLDGEEPTR